MTERCWLLPCQSWPLATATSGSGPPFGEYRTPGGSRYAPPDRYGLVHRGISHRRHLAFPLFGVGEPDLRQLSPGPRGKGQLGRARGHTRLTGRWSSVRRSQPSAVAPQPRRGDPVAATPRLRGSRSLSARTDALLLATNAAAT